MMIGKAQHGADNQLSTVDRIRWSKIEVPMGGKTCRMV